MAKLGASFVQKLSDSCCHGVNKLFIQKQSLSKEIIDQNNMAVATKSDDHEVDEQLHRHTNPLMRDGLQTYKEITFVNKSKKYWIHSMYLYTPPDDKQGSYLFHTRLNNTRNDKKSVPPGESVTTYFKPREPGTRYGLSIGLTPRSATESLEGHLYTVYFSVDVGNCKNIELYVFQAPKNPGILLKTDINTTHIGADFRNEMMNGAILDGSYIYDLWQYPTKEEEFI